MEIEASVATRFAAISPHLNERQRRLWVGSEARALGRGGVSLVARATGVSRPTVHKALEELDAPPLASGRVRRPGGGRKRLSATDPELAAALDARVDPDTLVATPCRRCVGPVRARASWRWR